MKFLKQCCNFFSKCFKGTENTKNEEQNSGNPENAENPENSNQNILYINAIEKELNKKRRE